MITAACFVVVVAGMRAAAGILIPFLLSVFIAIIFTPPLFWLQKKGLPNWLAIALIMAGIFVLSILFVAFVGTSVTDFTNSLPVYEKRLVSKSTFIVGWLNDHGVKISYSMFIDYFDPSIAMQMASKILKGLSGVLTNAFLILLTVIFILAEAAGFPDKLRAALAEPTKSVERLGRFTQGVNRYLALKTIFSVITGLFIWIWLAILGVNYALLWGLLALLLNFVPNIGSFIAAIPAVLLALVQLGSWHAMLAALGFLLVNIVIGSIAEPRFMGDGLGLSTLVVFLSLVFWGWILGPVGMLLSVPLTMIFKIALESTDETRWLSVMLGNDKPPGRSVETARR
ncbi:MAG: AI-2E family transporter [Deltaproteobacteria bacterium]|nr:AI-2E family transporter [Deltaproteobacteria bacterium]